MAKKTKKVPSHNTGCTSTTGYSKLVTVASLQVVSVVVNNSEAIADNVEMDDHVTEDPLGPMGDSTHLHNISTFYSRTTALLTMCNLGIIAGH